MKKSLLLQNLVRNIAGFKLPTGVFGESFLNGIPLIHGRLSTEGEIVGIRREATTALHALVEAIFDSSAQYQRGCSFDDLFRMVANTVIELRDRNPDSIGADDVAEIERKITVWFSENIPRRRVLTPCSIIAFPAKPFEVGPVSFSHGLDFVEKERANFGSVFEVTFQLMFAAMNAQGAQWLASLDVEGCMESRARELGDLGVDLAITAIQLVVPVYYSERMARVTARNAPAVRPSVSITAENISSANLNQLSGIGMTGEGFERLIAQGATILESAGRRVSFFVNGGSAFPKLEQQWCDAAYWFHEGLAEPLDTIAVPKLETAIEILLRSENSGGSERRLREAIRTFYGLEEDQPVSPTSQVTIAQFAKGFVRDRSRILHGTWSTLSTRLQTSRANLAPLVRGLLTNFMLELDAYANDAAAKDDTTTFLAWVEARRQRTASAPP